MIILNYRKYILNNLKTILVLITAMGLLSNVYAQNIDPGAASIEGMITDFSNNIKIGETIIFQNSATNKVYTAVSDNNGKFSVKLPYQNEYTIKIKGFNDEQYYTDFKIPALEENQTELYFDIDIQIETPKFFTLDNVYFDTGKATLKPASYEELNNLFEYLSLKKTTVIEIAGHTDDIGSDELNMTLSQNRAKSVRNYLIKKGIPPDRIVAKGYGETQPIAVNNSNENRAKNRRTEVRLIKE